MKNTQVKASTIHGKGLFAVRKFVAGEAIEDIEGEIVLRESSSKYAIQLSGRRTLLLTNKSKYVNQSQEPNCVLNLRKCKIVALRDIAAGEELTAAYKSVFG